MFSALVNINFSLSNWQKSSTRNMGNKAPEGVEEKPIPIAKEMASILDDCVIDGVRARGCPGEACFSRPLDRPECIV